MTGAFVVAGWLSSFFATQYGVSLPEYFSLTIDFASHKQKLCDVALSMQCDPFGHSVLSWVVSDAFAGLHGMTNRGKKSHKNDKENGFFFRDILQKGVG